MIFFFSHQDRRGISRVGGRRIRIDISYVFNTIYVLLRFPEEFEELQQPLAPRRLPHSYTRLAQNGIRLGVWISIINQTVGINLKSSKTNSTYRNFTNAFHLAFNRSTSTPSIISKCSGLSLKTQRHTVRRRTVIIIRVIRERNQF